MANFNIEELKQKALGAYYQRPVYPDLAARKVGNQQDIQTGVGTSARKNHLGRSYFMDVILDGITLPNEPLITISGQKRIVETVVVGSERRGSVKELISTDDYRIQIEGICYDPLKKNYPQKQVEDIIRLCEAPKALTIENDLTELFRIHKLVVKTYTLDKMKGQPYLQKYTINAVSDEDFYAILKNNK